MIICWSTKNKVAISSNFVFGISYDEVAVCERDSLFGTSIIMPPQYLNAAINLFIINNIIIINFGQFLVALLIFCHQTRTNVVLVGNLLHFHFLP